MEATDTVRQILAQTNYGIDIYAHILKTCFPDDDVVLSLSNRECKLCRNPFNEGKRTLYVWIEKSDICNSLSPELAYHRDIENKILPGDVFSFAGLFFEKKDDELLEFLKKELRIIDRKIINFNCRNSLPQKKIDGLPRFSFFKAPVVNTKPYKAITLLDAFNYITGKYAKERTEALRRLETARERSTQKASKFDYCTFSGTFNTRSDKMLVEHSGLICIDFDHLEDVETLFGKLLEDEYFDTQLLFRSPSGDGLKWVIPIDLQKCDHQQYFKAIEVYIRETYGVQIDKSGKDVSRACFLPYDPKAYINEKYLGA